MKPDHTWRRAKMKNALVVRNPFLLCGVIAALLLVTTGPIAFANDDDGDNETTTTSTTRAWHDDAVRGASILQEASENSACDSCYRFGDPRHWRWALLGTAAFDIDDDAEYYGGAVAFNYFLTPDLSAVFEFGGHYFDEPAGVPSDTGGGSLGALIRWHFYTNQDRTFSAWGEVGAGLLIADQEIPQDGSEANLTPQAGIGASWQLGDSPNRIMGGARWHHISNANLSGSDDNTGRDSILFYLGIDFPLN